MNKLLVLLLAASPLCSAAQEVQSPKVTPSKAPNHRYELSATGGIAFTSDGELLNGMYIGDFNTVSLYRNFGRMQLGVGVDFDIVGGDPLLLIPHAILNRTLQMNKVCLYAGVSAGYANIFTIQRFASFYKNRMSKGYMAGAQAGIVYDLGKHFSLTAETCVRYVEAWNKVKNYSVINNEYKFDGSYTPEHIKELYFPSKIGFRWRF